MHFLPVTSKSLARNADNIYREGALSLVRAPLTGELLLPGNGLIRFEATRHHDSISDESYRLGYEYVARLYSETARKTNHQKPNTFVLIDSICIVLSEADSVDHGLLTMGP
jgi:hypothetical protein